MIKAKGTTADGETILVFGLSFENLDRLRAGHPIQIDLTEMKLGLTGKLTIFAGRNEATMEHALREACGSLPPSQASKDGHLS
jgi:hypothetical protein